jgi:DNA replication protein DnaC
VSDLTRIDFGAGGDEAVETLRRVCAVEGCANELVLERHTGGWADRNWDFLASRELWCASCNEKADAREELENYRHEHERRVRARRDGCRLPKSLREVTWDKVKPGRPAAPAIAAAKQWGRGELTMLTLTGPVGTGKTFLSAAATWARAELDAVRWYYMPKLVRDSRGEWSSSDRAEVESALTGPSALVLDDLDKIKPSEWAIENLFLAVEHRVQNEQALLVTTNLELDELGDRFGAPLVDRLGGLGEVCYTTGDSRRWPR